jgi:hypothetical protein
MTGATGGGGELGGGFGPALDAADGVECADVLGADGAGVVGGLRQVGAAKQPGQEARHGRVAGVHPRHQGVAEVEQARLRDQAEIHVIGGEGVARAGSVQEHAVGPGRGQTDAVARVPAGLHPHAVGALGRRRARAAGAPPGGRQDRTGAGRARRTSPPPVRQSSKPIFKKSLPKKTASGQRLPRRGAAAAGGKENHPTPSGAFCRTALAYNPLEKYRPFVGIFCLR